MFTRCIDYNSKMLISRCISAVQLMWKLCAVAAFMQKISSQNVTKYLFSATDCVKILFYVLLQNTCLCNHNNKLKCYYFYVQNVCTNIKLQIAQDSHTRLYLDIFWAKINKNQMVWEATEPITKFVCQKKNCCFATIVFCTHNNIDKMFVVLIN